MSEAVTPSQKALATQPLARAFSPAAILWGAIVACGLLLAWLSLLRYSGYNAGMLDLGNMSQAIASVGRGEPLVFTYVNGPMSRLSLHVELFYYLFVPLYALWPDPRVLLVGQAALFALGAWPAYRLALRRGGSPFAACCIGLVYLLYPTAQTSVLFDFHGDTLALPMMMYMLDALDERAWRRYWIFLLLALSCKFYVAAPAALLGLLLWREGERRVGLLTSGLALGYGALAFLVVRPLFTTANTSQAHRGINYLSFYFGQFNDLFATLPDRTLSALVVFGPAMLLAWRGWRWLVPALPVAAAALLSTGPGGAFDFRYHHYAIVVPFIIMATVDGLARLQAARERNPRGRSWRGDTVMTLVITLIFSMVLVDTPLNPLFWLKIPGQGLDHSVYGTTSRDGVKDRFLARIPGDAPLAASAFLAPHLVNRHTLYLVRYPDDPGGKRLPTILPQVAYVLADGLFDWRMPTGDGFGGGLAYERAEIALLLRDPAFGLVAERDGLLLFQRDAPAEAALSQSVRTLPADSALTTIRTFGDGPELVSGRVEQVAGAVGERRLRATFIWRTTTALAGRDLVAVSRLEGVPDARFIHLPSYALLPTERWQPGQLIEETFEVLVPEEVAPGSYTWRTGWYDAGQLESAATDSRTRLGDEVVVTTVDRRTGDD